LFISYLYLQVRGVALQPDQGDGCHPCGWYGGGEGSSKVFQIRKLLTAWVHLSPHLYWKLKILLQGFCEIRCLFFFENNLFERFCLIRVTRNIDCKVKYRYRHLFWSFVVLETSDQVLCLIGIENNVPVELSSSNTGTGTQFCFFIVMLFVYRYSGLCWACPGCEWSRWASRGECWGTQALRTTSTQNTRYRVLEYPLQNTSTPGCGSGSGLDPDSVTLWIRIRIGNPDPGSGSRGKKVKKFQWKNALFSYFEKKFYH
jgi:hypothetical protein